MRRADPPLSAAEMTRELFAQYRARFSPYGMMESLCLWALAAENKKATQRRLSGTNPGSRLLYYFVRMMNWFFAFGATDWRWINSVPTVDLIMSPAPSPIIWIRRSVASRAMPTKLARTVVK